MSFNAEILYESEGKNLAGEPFITVKRARGYYEYAERGGMDSIAFILYDRHTDKFGLIFESKPPIDERFGENAHMLTAFGGSIDCDKSLKEICQMEVAEEAGFEVPLENIHSVGMVLVSTQMSQMCHLFYVDVTGIEKTLTAEYENTEEFNGNFVSWVTQDEIMVLRDWKAITIVAKVPYYLESTSSFDEL